MALQLATATRNSMADAMAAAVGANGILRILTGAAPANVAAAETGTALSNHTLDATFAPAASGGSLSPNLPTNVNAIATGTAGYYRVLTSGGTPIMQGTVGTSGTDMVVSSTSFISGGPVQINTWTAGVGGA